LDFEYLTDSRHFHLSSFYLQSGLRARAPELFRKMKDAGLYDFAGHERPIRDDGWEGGLEEALRYVDIFLPNEREAQKRRRLTIWRRRCKSSRRSCLWWW